MRADESVCSDCGAAFVFVPFTCQIGAARDVDARKKLAQLCRDCLFVLRVGIGIETEDADGFDLVPGDFAGKGFKI